MSRRGSLLAAVMLTALAACGSSSRTGSRDGAPPSPTTASPEPAPTEAPAAGTRILYLWENFVTRTQALYTADPDGGNRVEVSLAGSPADLDVLFVVPSLDGRFVAWYTGRELRVAPAGELEKSKVVATATSGVGITSVAWSADGSMLSYAVTRDLSEGPLPPAESKVYLVNRNGTGARLVTSTRDPDYIQLVGVDTAAKELYWFGSGGAGLYWFTIVDTADGSRKRVDKQFPPRDARPVFSRDFDRAWYADGRRVLEYEVRTATSRVLYEMASSGADEHGNPSRIGSLVAAPDGRLLAFAERAEPADTEVLNLLSMDDGSSRVLVPDDDSDQYIVQGWSPDGTALWLQAESRGASEYLIVDAGSGRRTVFFRPARRTVETDEMDAESAFFEAWLTP